jgi:hypothetical protein
MRRRKARMVSTTRRIEAGEPISRPIRHRMKGRARGPRGGVTPSTTTPTAHQKQTVPIDATHINASRCSITGGGDIRSFFDALMPGYRRRAVARF